MYGVDRPPAYDSSESWGMKKWFERVADYIRSRTNLATVTTAYTVPSNVFYVRGDATGGAFSVTLPPAADNTGRQIVIKKIDASVNAVTIDPMGSETLDGAATVALSSQYAVRHCISNGSNWEVL